MKFLGIIFDFNGVLWWDNHLQEQAWSQFAEQFSGIYLTSEEMASQVHGRNNRHTLEFLAGTNLDDEQIEQLSGQKETISNYHLEQQTFWMTWLPTELLGQLPPLQGKITLISLWNIYTSTGGLRLRTLFTTMDRDLASLLPISTFKQLKYWG